MKHGISKKSFELIVNVLKGIPEIEKVAIFGSRAMGNYKKGSDIDMVLYGKCVTPEMVNNISVTLNEKLPIPYYIDLVAYMNLTNIALKEHIDEFSVVIYRCNE